MSKFHRILCPVDLSENSFAAIEMATTLAKQQDAKVAFLYDSPLWLPENSKPVGEYSRGIIDEEKTRLNELRPSDPSIGYEHHYVHEDVGPAVAKATKSADVVVLSTRGPSGVMQMPMRCVANFVLRSLKCSLVLVKGLKIARAIGRDWDSNEENAKFATEVMHPISPVHASDEMEDVLTSLQKARETAAPIVDSFGKYIGILTTTDIERLHSLQARFEAKDESVIEEMFERDEFGQRCSSNHNFGRVERDMTKDVISIRDIETVQRASEPFDASPDIHYSVALDEDHHPVGIVDVLNATEIQLFEFRQAI